MMMKSSSTAVMPREIFTMTSRELDDSQLRASWGRALCVLVAAMMGMWSWGEVWGHGHSSSYGSEDPASSSYPDSSTSTFAEPATFAAPEEEPSDHDQISITYDQVERFIEGFDETGEMGGPYCLRARKTHQVIGGESILYSGLHDDSNTKSYIVNDLIGQGYILYLPENNKALEKIATSEIFKVAAKKYIEDGFEANQLLTGIQFGFEVEEAEQPYLFTTTVSVCLVEGWVYEDDDEDDDEDDVEDDDVSSWNSSEDVPFD